MLCFLPKLQIFDLILIFFFFSSSKWHFSFLISIVYQGSGSQRAAAAASLGMLNSWLSAVTRLHICTKFALLRESQFQFQGKKNQRCQKASWCGAADRRLLLDSVHHPAPRRKFWANHEGADFSELLRPHSARKLIWQQRCLSVNYLSCSSSKMTPNICFSFCVVLRVVVLSCLWHWSQFAQD